MTDRAPIPNEAGSDVRRRRLNALAETNLVGKETSTEILQRVTDLAADLLPASLGSIAVLVTSDGNHTAAAGSGAADAARDLAALEEFEDVAGRSIRESLQPSIVPSVDGGAGAVKAYVGVPIKIEGRYLGVLYVLEDAPRQYDDDDIDFLRLLAGRAAAAISHSGVFAEMRSARERSEALAWVANAVIAAADLDEVLEAVVEGIAAAVAADEAEVITVDKGHQRVTQHARAGLRQVDPDIETLDGVAGMAIRESRVIIAAEGEPASVVAPLNSGGETMGALFVQRPGTAFTEEEVDLIVAMANQVAIAIDNVRLLDTTRSALRETEAMYAMAQELVAGSDLPELMDAVARGTVTALPADGARVVMADASEFSAQATAGMADDKEWTTTAGLAGTVLSSTQPVIEPRALIVPLMVHSRLLGVLEAVNHADSPEFTPHQFDTLQAAAAQAAVAIENHLLFGEVQRLAITDELTGVNTRRHLFALGQREFAQSVRFRKPLAAIMFDLDHFKSINDTLGHLVGDEVLAGVADRCSKVLREIDVLGRYGGEEFAVILPEASVEAAMTVAERVRRSISDEPVETARGPVAVTVSVGVAQVGPGVLDLKTLIDRADAAMYAAKAAGRDRVMAA